LPGLRGLRRRDTSRDEKPVVQACDLGCPLLEREVPRIENVNLGIGGLASEGLGAGDSEGGVMESPNDQDRGTPLAQIGLPARVGRDIGSIIVSQIQL
jgi:hypothetical protein